MAASRLWKAEDQMIVTHDLTNHGKLNLHFIAFMARVIYQILFFFTFLLAQEHFVETFYGNVGKKGNQRLLCASPISLVNEASSFREMF